MKQKLNDFAISFFFSFVPSFLRLGSWNIVMFVSFEQIKRAVVKFQQAQQSPL